MLEELIKGRAEYAHATLATTLQSRRQSGVGLHFQETAMPHTVPILLPQEVLLRLAPRLTNLFADIHTDDTDVQCLRLAIAAAANACTSDAEDSSRTPQPFGVSSLPPSPSSSVSIPNIWNDSSPTLGPSSAASARSSPGLELECLALDSDNDTPAMLDHLAPPHANTPSANNSAYSTYYTRKRKFSHTSSMGDEVEDGRYNRGCAVSRESLRELAARVDAERIVARNAARLRGGWDPECNRGGDRYWQGPNVALEEVQDGAPMVPGPDGLRGDPSISQQEGYSAGIGTRSAGEVAGGDDEDMGESEVEREDGGQAKKKRVKKPKGAWKKRVTKTVLRKDAHQLVASFTSISCARPQAELFSLVQCLTSPSSTKTQSTIESEWVIGSAISSTSAIATLVDGIKVITLDARALQFRRIIMLMQLAILVD